MRQRIVGWGSTSVFIGSCLAASACSSAHSGTTTGTGDAPIELHTTEFLVPAGAEIQSCYYTTLSNDHDLLVQQYDATQVKGGHHVIMFEPVNAKPDGTVEDCTQGDAMVNYRPLVLTSELNHLKLPDNLGIRIRAHAHVVLQSHYINTTTDDIKAVDTVKLQFAKAGAQVEQLGFWATSVLDLNIPPLQKYTMKYECSAPQDMKVISLIGHMHNNGAQLSIDLGAPGNVQRVYTIDTWESTFRDTPPAKTWTMADPLVVHSGDLIDVSCTWNSTASQTLHFPAEMCASNAWYYPATESITCGGTVLTGASDGGAPALFQGTDQCANSSDRAVLAKPSTNADVQACGVQCLGGGACDCLVGLGLSQGCAACYGDNIKCGAANCIVPCANGDSPDCSACVAQHCAAFKACTGS